jgi:hypothetical protein
LFFNLLDKDNPLVVEDHLLVAVDTGQLVASVLVHTLDFGHQAVVDPVDSYQEDVVDKLEHQELDDDHKEHLDMVHLEDNPLVDHNHLGIDFVEDNILDKPSAVDRAVVVVAVVEYFVVVVVVAVGGLLVDLLQLDHGFVLGDLH